MTVVYSHSRVSSFENCPRRYAFRYVEQIPTDWESVEAFLGKRVHEILERLYHHLRRHGRPPSLSQIHERFRKDWHALWHPQVRIVRGGTDVHDYLRKGEECLSHYYRSHYPFDQGETVAIEHEVQISLDGSERYRLRGIIDRVVRTREGGYEIHDYKTGGNLPSLAKLTVDRQLAVYQLGIQQTYPDAQEVELVWHYLQFNKTLRVRHSPEDLDARSRETMAAIDEIEAAQEFPGRPGPLCRWCEYGEVCPDGPNGERAAAARARAESAAPPDVPAAPALPCPRGQLPLF